MSSPTHLASCGWSLPHQQDLKYGLHDHFVHMVANVGTSKEQIATFDRNPPGLYGKNTLMETIYMYIFIYILYPNSHGGFHSHGGNSWMVSNGKSD